MSRDGEDWRSNRVVLNKEVIAPRVQGNFVPLLDEVGQDFVARIYKKIERSGQNKWTVDLHQELFKYALECKVWHWMSPSVHIYCRVTEVSKVTVLNSSHFYFYNMEINSSIRGFTSGDKLFTK